MTYLRQSEVFEAGKWVPKSTSDVFKIALFLIENAIDDKLSELSEYDRICNYMFSTCTFKRNLAFMGTLNKYKNLTLTVTLILVTLQRLGDHHTHTI